MSDTAATDPSMEMVECPKCGQPATLFALQAEEARFYYWAGVVRGHSERFRQVSSRYPRVVAEAYDGDIERAAEDSDQQVAATVAAWAHARGLPPRDWYAVGAEERAYEEALGRDEPLIW